MTKCLDRRRSVERAVLEVHNLQTHFFLRGGRTVKAVDGVDFTVERGRVLGLVGESGSGKSTVGLSILRLLDPRARIVGGEILFQNQNLRTLSEKKLKQVRGRHISMVFQDPTTALNPVTTIGRQLKHALSAHRGLSTTGIQTRAVELLDDVELSDPERVLAAYPHELSGGMRQRVVIAMALASGASLIIADEPTTGLDVTTQREILYLFDDLIHTGRLSMLFITHDFGVVAYMCDDVCVMQNGKIVEYGPVEKVLESPTHPYTRRLLDAIPDPK